MTPERTKRFFAAIRRGNPPDAAACVAGFGRSTFREWLAQGEKDRAAGLETEHTEFLDGTERANALFFDKHLRRIDDATAGRGAGGTGGARLSLALLGRRAPEYFAERKAVELTGKNGGAIQVERKDPRQMTEAEIEAEIAALSAAGESP